MYEIAFLYNRNIANENEVVHMREERSIGDSIVSVRRPLVKRFIPKRDTIDLSILRMRKR